MQNTLPRAESWKRISVIIDSEYQADIVVKQMERGKFVTIEKHRRDKWSDTVQNFVPYWIIRALYPADMPKSQLVDALKFDFSVTLQGVPDGNSD